MRKRKKSLYSMVIFVCAAAAYCLSPVFAAENAVPSADKGEKETFQHKKTPFAPRNPEKWRRGQNRRGRRPGGSFFLGKLTPEEHSELRRLSASGEREKFNSKLRELRKKYASEDEKKIHLLEEKYHAAKTQEEKDTIRKELKEAVHVLVKKRNDLALNHIASVEEKLRKLKAFHAKNVSNAEKITEKITEHICTPPAERKHFRRMGTFRTGMERKRSLSDPPPSGSGK